MYCSSCGAKLKDTDEKCSYCGTINPSGAENRYMERLDEILEETDEIDDNIPKEYTKEIKSQGHFAAKVALTAGAVCLVFFLIIGGITLADKVSHEHYRKQAAYFQKEYFPKLNEIYDSGDDDEVLAYIDELLKIDGSEAVFNWKHANYYDRYRDYKEVISLRDKIQDKSYSDYEFQTGIYAALKLSCMELSNYELHTLSKDEIAKIEGFTKESDELFYLDLQMSAQQLDDFYEKCSSENYPDYNLYKKYLPELEKLLS
jgi:cell division protein FtsI/penicillin-binding protein 2